LTKSYINIAKKFDACRNVSTNNTEGRVGFLVPSPPAQELNKSTIESSFSNLNTSTMMPTSSYANVTYIDPTQKKKRRFEKVVLRPSRDSSSDVEETKVNTNISIKLFEGNKVRTE
jgi:hypothetical protein